MCGYSPDEAMLLLQDMRRLTYEEMLMPIKKQNHKCLQEIVENDLLPQLLQASAIASTTATHATSSNDIVNTVTAECSGGNYSENILG